MTVYGEKNFYMPVPLLPGQPNLKEVYPLLKNGSCAGDGFRYYFQPPKSTAKMTWTYQGRVWPLRFQLFDSSGAKAHEETFIGSDYVWPRSLSIDLAGKPVRNPWSFAIQGYGQMTLLAVTFDRAKDEPFYFAARPEKLFTPQPAKP